MSSLCGPRWRGGAGLLLAAAIVAGCGSASRGDEYSVRQVKGAFAAQGIVLHRVKQLSLRGAAWLTTRARPGGEPSVTVVVITPASRAQFTFQTAGSHRRGWMEKRLGDVRVVLTRRTLTGRVQAALTQLGHERPPQAPPAATIGTAVSPPRPPTLAQLLAKLPRPLRDALERTAAVSSAHIALRGWMTGSGDFSTVRRIGSLHTSSGGYAMDEVIAGTTMYTRSSWPGREAKAWSRKWFEREVNQRYAAVRTGWPQVALFTFVQPLDLLGAAGRVSTLGREKVDGVETVHYRKSMSLGPRGYLSRMPRAARGFMAEVVDVWVGTRDGLIHRASFCFAGAGETADISRFGEKVHVTVPPAREVVVPSALLGHAKERLQVVTASTSISRSSSGERCGKP